MGKQGPHLGSKTPDIIDYIKREFGNDTFAISQIEDRNVRNLLLKYVSYKYNVPNSLSNEFDIIPRQLNKGKRFKLKKMV